MNNNIILNTPFSFRNHINSWFRSLFLVLFLFLSSFLYSQRLPYPEAKKGEQVDDFFGKEVADPYRGLEDLGAQETIDWVKAENKVTSDYLTAIPFREKIRDRLTKIWNYPRYSAPFKSGDYYFYYKNDGLQEQNVLYVRNGSDAMERVLLDPNKLSVDGSVTVSSISVSNDHEFLGYSLARGGSDWQELHVLEVESGKVLDDEIKWVKFSNIAWQRKGFYYSRYDEPPKGEERTGTNENHKVYYHKIGTPQNTDILFYENKKFPQRSYRVQMTTDEHFLILYESETTNGNAVYITDLVNAKNKLIKVVENFDGRNTVINNIGNRILMYTNNATPKYKLVSFTLDGSKVLPFVDVIPQRDEVLQDVVLAKNRIIAQYEKDASSKLYMFDYDGKQLGEIKLATFVTVEEMSANKEDSLLFYSYVSFTIPPTIVKYNLTNNQYEHLNKTDIDFNSADYETKQVFYKSKDGTNIPMFITYKKGLILGGDNPTFLYGYGGFSISKPPEFKVERLVFLENGGVLAWANIRGGSEYGEEWHRAAVKEKKQNCFDDFIAAAEYLVQMKYTNSKKLAVSGRSNGGLLIGAVMTQRPELFKVAVPVVGVMDMLRFQKFTIGYKWIYDYGSSDDANQFKFLYKYSPLHNLKDGVNYPATLVITGDHDDRVIPAHSYKFAATLQEKNKTTTPTLIRIGVSGHQGVKATSKLIDEQTDIWTFIFYNLGMTPQ